MLLLAQPIFSFNLHENVVKGFDLTYHQLILFINYSQRPDEQISPTTISWTRKELGIDLLVTHIDYLISKSTTCSSDDRTPLGFIKTLLTLGTPFEVDAIRPNDNPFYEMLFAELRSIQNEVLIIEEILTAEGTSPYPPIDWRHGSPMSDSTFLFSESSDDFGFAELWEDLNPVPGAPQLSSAQAPSTLEEDFDAFYSDSDDDATVSARSSSSEGSSDSSLSSMSRTISTASSRR
jgi:hypothetical protein